MDFVGQEPVEQCQVLQWLGLVGRKRKRKGVGQGQVTQWLDLVEQGTVLGQGAVGELASGG